MKIIRCLSYALLTLTLLIIVSANAATLDQVRDKGFLQCGVSQGLAGFSTTDDQGRWSGLDVDTCRAVAAAVFGDGEKVRFTPMSAKERFIGLQSGEIDILARTTTWTLNRDAGQGMDYTAVTYYDGQGFMVPRELGVESTLELDGAVICTNTGTTTELNVADYFRTNGMQYDLLAYEKTDEAVTTYDSGRCDAYTTDRSALYSLRLRLRDPEAHMVLPEVISKEPLGPLVRQGDAEWSDIVRWTIFALIAAEEYGLSSETVEAAMQTDNPEVRRFLGLEGNLGGQLGLERSWAKAVILAVGNYGEIFERNLGASSALQIERGLNALWTEGGLLYAPPFR